ncbi:MAG: tetratricopeptide repeat protein [Hoeflea sp.]|uniref:tetratricopeptide repeat protein n=1 Tax=Hoeflea sp. TaxID=1940281 RepID=UPI001DB46B61|nr:tetratricopeptide repeat protein [Hoeflea sp.]MBU4530315.1 tetratricopeptide repeat protein [Alphaproteobacteria bacterium]MBU4545102.1 tetratricopeptide repeat protein [Alphaproteobacteria bacterium]MBU4549698.1 tetratricopeptide repeat protein [Alphaproteobacteria bacterium]MBV1721905.1 tetratricopeptide repeat protein [Hoeflea sp.]MBV1761255.1 tetratricopeptide repeat protein [Hoeflea sp.]
MHKDAQGNALSGADNEVASLFDQAVEAFNIYRGDPVGLADQAIAIAPGFAMAHILKAHLFGLATEPEATKEARAILGTVKSLRLTEREASHAAALDLLLGGEWTAAATALDRHNIDHPHDIVALQAGHLMDFYRANARNLRDRIARVLPKWSDAVPGHSIVLGMHAFGLEETGDYARAEEAGRRALDLQPLDSWAHHAVAHVMEMQGRAEDGIGWMIAREPHWTGDDNFFRVHNWWHRALCHLDLGQADQVLALYDGPIRQDRSMVALDMVDASALLWRLNLTGHDVGDRWQELATAWDSHADGRSYPFNDWHAVMAYLGAGRAGDAERILAGFREGGGAAEVDAWGRKTALPLVEGFAAFWQGDYETAAVRLHGARQIANTFGGSHAQRDIIDWTLTEATLRGGLTGMAEALACERLALKPHSPVNRSFLGRARANANPGQKAA